MGRELQKIKNSLQGNGKKNTANRKLIIKMSKIVEKNSGNRKLT